MCDDGKEFRARSGGNLCGEFPGGADETRTACHRDKRSRLVGLTDDDGFCFRIGRGELVGEVEFTLALGSEGGIGFGVGAVFPPVFGVRPRNGNSLSALRDSESSIPEPTWMTQSRPMLVLFSSKDLLDSPDSRLVSLVFGNRMDGVSESTGMNRLEPENESLISLSIKISPSTFILHPSACSFANFAPCCSNPYYLGNLTSDILSSTFLSSAISPQLALR